MFGWVLKAKTGLYIGGVDKEGGTFLVIPHNVIGIFNLLDATLFSVESLDIGFQLSEG